MRSSNPTLNANTFTNVGNNNGIDGSMTLDGTVNKSMLLIGLVMIGFVGVWKSATIVSLYLFPIIIVTFVVSIIIIFFKKTAPILAPIYAILEGMALGVISAFAELSYPGIAFQTISLTLGIFIGLLLAYKSGLIQASENFKLGIIAATFGIGIVYLISFLGIMTGWYHIPFIHESGWMGIGFSVFVVIIAALNLVLDFDFIEQGVKNNAPKYMEWFASFSLLITLVWLYMEVLRLLMKSRD